MSAPRPSGLGAVLAALGTRDATGQTPDLVGTCSRCGHLVNAYDNGTAAYHAGVSRACPGWGQPVRGLLR